jgi:hypothetical protein
MKVGDLVRLSDGVTIGTIIETGWFGCGVLWGGKVSWLVLAQIKEVIA